MNEERISLMLEEKHLRGRIDQLEGTIGFYANHIEQSNRTSLNRLIEAARRLPDAPIDPDGNPEIIAAKRERSEALRKLEGVRRRLEALNEYTDHTSGAGC